MSLAGYSGHTVPMVNVPGSQSGETILQAQRLSVFRKEQNLFCADDINAGVLQCLCKCASG